MDFNSLSELLANQSHRFRYAITSLHQLNNLPPKQLPEVKTSWLAFPLTIKDDAKFSRLEIVKYLESNGIQTRPVFTGNILRQPAFKNIKHKNIEQKFNVTENIMRNSFLVGCNHGLSDKQMEKMNIGIFY